MKAISPHTLEAMRQIEERDAADRLDGTGHSARLRAIGPETGEFLRTLIVAMCARVIVEVGTGAGYSAMWMAQGTLITAGRIVTFETDPAKAALARRNFKATGLEDYVDLRESDGGEGLRGFAGTADLVFLDAEKADYMRFLEPAILALRPGGLLVADNLISHASELTEFRAAALADPRLTGLVVPVGQGELLAVRL
jgi:caffeoyl-CoA O-methyltransferase